jgi:methionine biosynthesis protein MetW
VRLFSHPKLITDHFDYDKYWLSKKLGKMGIPNLWQKERAEWIAKRIKSDSSVLDLGCGDGSVLLHMKGLINFKPLGADISDSCIDFLKSKKIKAFKLEINDLNKIKAISRCDYILMLEVLEHIQYPEDLLTLTYKNCKKGIFFSIPNTGYITYRLRLLLGRFPVQWRLHPGEHVRFWTLKDLRWWLGELNLIHKSNIHLYQGIPYLNKIFPGLFGAGIIVEIKK